MTTCAITGARLSLDKETFVDDIADTVVEPDAGGVAGQTVVPRLKGLISVHNENSRLLTESRSEGGYGLNRDKEYSVPVVAGEGSQEARMSERRR